MQRALAVCVTALTCTTAAWAAGILTPIGSPDQPIQIRDHHVNVVINNGFAMTEVLQTFFNPNQIDLEAIYSFPLPRSASLSEMTITAGEKEINGEVLPRQRARELYEEEKARGRDAGLAEKNGYQTFQFYVYPVRAQGETHVRFLYYQPLEIDTGVGRYLYPLEDGGTDEEASSFWLGNEKVEKTFSVRVELKSVHPIADVRCPGYETIAAVKQLGEGHYTVEVDVEGGSLGKDFLFYYRLQDGLPGRIELVPFRDDPDGAGTFMLVVTPGVDLKPVSGGLDHVFVLDVSGSMKGKIQTLANGVGRALGKLRPEDRYRVVTFNTGTKDLTGGWRATTTDQVQRTLADLGGLAAEEGTDIYSGMQEGLRKLEDDRPTSFVLVTDGVANTGIVEPKEFDALMKKHDVRVFGFLLGNSANWPLMKVICDSTGGFYAAVSNADDVLGQIELARSKITHECLHDATLSIKGVRVMDATQDAFGKVYRGQQLVLFGRYEGGGEATVTLRARLSGEDRTYSTTFAFPEMDAENPEIERLWAMAMVEEIEHARNLGNIEVSEAGDAIRDLGVTYQIVTDETSMVVMDDSSFDEYGVDRRNRERMERDRQARALRAQQVARNTRIDQGQTAFNHPSPSVGGGGGGGAIDPLSGGLVLCTAALAAMARRRRKRFDE